MAFKKIVFFSLLITTGLINCSSILEELKKTYQHCLEEEEWSYIEQKKFQEYIVYYGILSTLIKLDEPDNSKSHMTEEITQDNIKSHIKNPEALPLAIMCIKNYYRVESEYPRFSYSMRKPSKKGNLTDHIN